VAGPPRRRIPRIPRSGREDLRSTRRTGARAVPAPGCDRRPGGDPSRGDAEGEAAAVKLVIAVIQGEDAPQTVQALSSAGISVTKLASSGGFLQQGNTTLMIGV